MVLEYAHSLVDGHDYAELPIRVVVGHHLGSPEVKVVRAPSEAGVQLVIDNFGKRGSEDLAGYDRFVGRILGAYVPRQPVVLNLAEMKRRVSGDPKHEDRDKRDDEVPACEHAQTGVICSGPRTACKRRFFIAAFAPAYSLPKIWWRRLLPLFSEHQPAKSR